MQTPQVPALTMMLLCSVPSHSPNYKAFHTAVTTGTPDVLGTYTVTHLNTMTQPLSARRVITQGIISYEPFGGLCAALEATLRNGIQVHRYYYSDISAQLVAQHRINQLA